MSSQVKQYQKAVKAFLGAKKDAPLRRIGNYQVTYDKLIYRSLVTEEVRLYFYGEKNADTEMKKRQEKLREAEEEGLLIINYMNDWRAEIKHYKQDTIAIRIRSSGQVVGNSSVLPLIGRRMVWGNEKPNRGETDVQRELAKTQIMVPFNVFKEANLDIEQFVMIDKGPSEEITRKVRVWKRDKQVWKDETIHFTGASLFRVGHKCFLFDVDRRELKHKIVNPFLAELPRICKTIKDAYDSLIPDEVRKAIKRGAKVKRQGEWFFIPTAVKAKPDMNTPDQSRWQRSPFQRFELRAGPNRPNYVTKGNAKLGVYSGQVTHAGREHAPLNLGDVWHKAIPNTATKSFTIVGDVD